MIKLIKFGGEWIIAKIEEIPDVTFGDPDCILKYPYQIEGNCFGPWPVYSDDREIVVRSSDITLVAEPKQYYLSQYTSLLRDEEQINEDNFIEEIDEE